MLETLRIAATGAGLRADWAIRADCGDAAPIYDVKLVPDAAITPDALLAHIETRVVQRRPMHTTPLTEAQRAALVAAVGRDYALTFFESFRDRFRVAGLLWDNARIRLTCPEAYLVHKSVIEWGARFSKDRIPEQAVGVDPLTARLMRYVMQRWERVEFFNRYLMGTIAPRIQLDFVPALACAAHVLLRPRQPLAELADYVRAGIAMQRLWLTATSVGLHLQPAMTPVIFRWYVQAGERISSLPPIDPAANALAARFERLAGAARDDPFAFFGRVGVSAVPTSRSVRKELDELMKA
ncbi:MAG TPA: molybdopterin biosynthesis protein MoeY [Azoarcus taiwanensis]|nr:molybdopterin biosynthesis protein MoeY [Azoarcus taiwanensis]